MSKEKLSYTTKYVLDDFHHDGVTCLAISLDGTLLASGGLDGLVFVWSLDTGHLLYDFKVHRSIFCSTWSHQTPDCLILGCENGLVMTVVVKQDEIQTYRFKAHNKHVECLSLAQSRLHLATGAHDEVTVWRRDDSRSRERVDWIASLVLPRSPAAGDITKELTVVSLHWQTQPQERGEGRDGTLIAAYLWHGIICWDLVSSSIVWQIHASSCLSSALSPDRRFLAIYMLPHIFQVHDIVAGAEVKTMHSPSEDGCLQLKVAFAHDGLALVGGSVIGRVRLWDASSGDRLQVLPHEGKSPVQAIVTHYIPSSDTFLIVTGTSEGQKSKIYVWHTSGHQEKCQKPQTFANRFYIYITGQDLLIFGFVGALGLFTIVLVCSFLYSHK